MFTLPRILKNMYLASRWCYEHNVKSLAKILTRIMSLFFGAEIHYKAKLPSDFRIHHGYGLIISSGVEVGRNFHVNQGVTIGGNWGRIANGRSFPVIGDNVWIMAGAKVVGPITIGSNVIVGANSVVTRDIPGGVVVAGIPAVVIREIDADDIAIIEGG